eukprot:3915791-Ditylum_brightwellii.AAC.1
MALLQHCPSIAHHRLRHRSKMSTTNYAFYLHPPHPCLHCQLVDWAICTLSMIRTLVTGFIGR